jgi:peroxiredoxin Q/BCP
MNRPLLIRPLIGAKTMATKKATKSTKRTKATRKATKKTTKKKVAKVTKKAVKKKTAAKKTTKAIKRVTKSTKATKKTAAKKRAATKRKVTPRQVSPKKPAKPVPPKGRPTTHPLVGKLAPDFELVDGQHQPHRLSDYRGRTVVLYFYPRDNTPGCTKEACGFNDTRAEFKKRNAVVMGISPDNAASHAKFAQKFKLQFALLADPEHAVAEMYGAWGEKNMYGKVSYGILRTTYIIDPDGRVVHVFEKVKADGHEQQVLAYLDQ